MYCNCYCGLGFVLRVGSGMYLVFVVIFMILSSVDGYLRWF